MCRFFHCRSYGNNLSLPPAENISLFFISPQKDGECSKSRLFRAGVNLSDSRIGDRGQIKKQLKNVRKNDVSDFENPLLQLHTPCEMHRG
jgi:hypothetical protein